MLKVFALPTTAEQVVLAVDSVVVSGQPTSVQFVAEFSNLSPDLAEAALILAADLGLLELDANGTYHLSSPLCRFVASPNLMQRATVIRVLLESYPPFVMFRKRLSATDSPSEAGKQTRVALGLTANQEFILSTLISLGTYSQALSTEGGGRYVARDFASPNALEHLLRGCSDSAAAETRIRRQIGEDAERVVNHDHVVAPLADSLRRAEAGDSSGAVTQAGNAVESYLLDFAVRLGVNVSTKPGINAKIDELRKVAQQQMPTKLANVGKYLGHIRNAADHGSDPELGAPWAIRESTGTEYVFVACSFIAATTALAIGSAPQI